MKQVTFLADASFRDCDWAQLCEKFGWDHAIRVACNKQDQPEMVAIISNQIACRGRLREYDRCMSIEQSFRDDKSSGFEMEQIRLQHAERIDHLLLALAIATLWRHELGEFVLKRGETLRCQAAPAHKRTLSIFQLGLRWLKRALATGHLCLPGFQAVVSNYS